MIGPQQELGKRLLTICSLTDRMITDMPVADRAILNRLHLAIVRENSHGISHLSIEDQLLVCFDLCHHLHVPRHWAKAVELVRECDQAIDWGYVKNWADR